MNFYRQYNEADSSNKNKFIKFIAKNFLPTSWQITRKIIGGRWLLIEIDNNFVVYNLIKSKFEKSKYDKRNRDYYSNPSRIFREWHLVDKNFPCQNSMPYKLDAWATALEFEDWINQ